MSHWRRSFCWHRSKRSHSAKAQGASVSIAARAKVPVQRHDAHKVAVVAAITTRRRHKQESSHHPQTYSRRYQSNLRRIHLCFQPPAYKSTRRCGKISNSRSTAIRDPIQLLRPKVRARARVSERIAVSASALVRGQAWVRAAMETPAADSGRTAVVVTVARPLVVAGS